MELIEVEFLHEVVPQDVSSSKEPAPSTALLVSDRTGLELDLVIEDVRVGDEGLAGLEGRAEVGVVEDGACKLELGFAGDLFFP